MKTLMDAGILAEGGSREAVNEFGLDPRNLADLLIDLGRRASAAEDIDNMRLCYCQAHTIAQDSEDLSDIAEDLLHWGKVLRQRMDLDDSIELLQEASDVFPNNGFIVEALEQTILLTGDKKDALVLCKDELLANPELFQLYSRLDSLLKDRGDAAYRIEVWRNMVNSHEEAVAAYYYLGQALEAIEDWEGAQDVYRKGHDLDPEDGRFPGPLAWVQFQLGQKGPVKRAPRMGMRRIPEREPAPATAAIMPPELTYQPVRITGQSGF
jgi:tetratricopeptide (TPR) repeat protein